MNEALDQIQYTEIRLDCAIAAMELVSESLGTCVFHDSADPGFHAIVNAMYACTDHLREMERALQKTIDDAIRRAGA